MYKILVVDDEPRASMGIKNFLLGSDLPLSGVETALNGFEAIDYLRMDTFDLVLTDIQMSRMSGIELMETIYLEQPHLPVIVISAHEKFDFAKKSLRLGARDYLVKPVERDDLLRVVGNVLREKEEIGRKSLEMSRKQREEETGRSGDAGRNELLIELVTEGNLSSRDYDRLAAELGGQRQDRLFAVILTRLDLNRGGFSRREISLQDRKLLKYAAINVLEECLSEWNGLTFNGYGSELVSIVQLVDREETGRQLRVKSQLNLIGQMIPANLKQFVNLEATAGISTLHADARVLPKLMEEAASAAERRSVQPGGKVFFYEDRMAQENASLVRWMAQVDAFARELKTNIDEPYRDGANALVDALRDLGETEELFNSCFGMLVYRLYALLLEFGHANGMKLHRFDPDAYFRDVPRDRKLERLGQYLEETVRMARQLARERDQSTLARIMGYIRQHYRNPELKIQDIAGEVHFSAAYVSHLFKKERQMNIWDYVTELRIEEAKHLLATTDKKRYEVAYEVGYESPEHFGRMFKRYVGISPAEYRKEGQGGSG